MGEKPYHKFCIIFILGVVGCRYSDRNQAYAETYALLQDWGKSLETAHKVGVDVAKYPDLESAYKELKQLKIIEAEGWPGRMKRDYWERPFRWEIRKQGMTTIIRIISDGRDGISQKGEGDDLYLDFSIPQKGKAKSYIKPYRR
jgi:hypothetical protein